MITKQQAIIAGAATCLVAVVAAGAYQMSHQNDALGPTQSNTVSTQPPPAALSPSANQAAPPLPSFAQTSSRTVSGPSPFNTANTSSQDSSYVEPRATAYGPAPVGPKLVGPGLVGPLPGQPGLQPETPRVASTYVQPGPGATTVVEKKEVVYKPVYRNRVVAHHHRSKGKVHVARAAKHTAMFVAKLPGRIRL